jgi:Peptidase S24-like
MSETRELFDAPQLNLAAQVLASGGTVRLCVRGNSMLPSLWPGDILTIESACPAPVIGDIVLVLHNHRPLIHRLLKKQDFDGRHQWVTRGDAVPRSDPPVESSALLGRVSAIERNRRVIVPRGRLSSATRLLAWVLCHWDRFRSVCLRMHSFRQSLNPPA